MIATAQPVTLSAWAAACPSSIHACFHSGPCAGAGHMTGSTRVHTSPLSTDIRVPPAASSTSEPRHWDTRPWLCLELQRVHLLPCPGAVRARSHQHLVPVPRRTCEPGSRVGTRGHCDYRGYVVDFS